MSDEQIEIEAPDDEGEIEIEAPEQPAAPQSFDLGSVIQNTLKSVVGAVGDEAGASWESLKSNWEASHAPPQDKSLWGRAKNTFDGLVATGRIPIDAFNIAMSPITAAIGAADRGLASTGAFQEGDLSTAMQAVRPGKIPGRPTSYAKPPTQGELQTGAASARTAVSESKAPGWEAGGAAVDTADNLRARAMRGKMVEDAITMAKQNKSGGFDNAIRTQFKRLWKEANGNAELGFSPDELAAISKVAEGGLIRNALSALGTLSPTAGRMSGVLWGAGAASAPFVPGALPAIAAGAATTMGARGGANALAGRAARRAGDVVRSGERGLNARTYQDLANQITGINKKVEDVIRRNNGSVPTREDSLYSEYLPLRDERNRIFREMRATPRM